MDLRTDALTILHRALAAVDPGELVRSYLSEPLIPTDSADLIPPSPPFLRGGNLVVIGTGKGTAPMAQAAEEILGDWISGGAITVKYGYGLPLQAIKVYEAGHPIPDQATLDGTEAILNLVKDLGEDDLVLALISGGGSALLELPAPPLTLDDLKAVNQALLDCGADITEMNAVRKHLSLVKGGRLAQAIWPARLVTLAVSDVIGDPPEAISSGPTAPDPTTFADAWKVVEKYHIYDRLPMNAIQRLKDGLESRIPDNPKPGDPLFERAVYHIIGSNRIMLDAAKSAAESLGYQAEVLTDHLSGEARDQGQRLAALLKERQAQSPGPPMCLLAGGEPTVTIRGKGKGGRNQELALAGALELAGSNGCLLLSAGSDGTDGPTDAAGALAEGTTISRAESMNLNAWDYLNRNDSYPFFQPLGDLVVTGPTRTNVMDIVILLSKTS